MHKTHTHTDTHAHIKYNTFSFIFTLNTCIYKIMSKIDLCIVKKIIYFKK